MPQPAFNSKRSAEDLQAIDQSTQTRPLGQSGSPDSVVRDREKQALLFPFDPDGAMRCLCMPGDVGKGLRADEVRGGRYLMWNSLGGRNDVSRNGGRFGQLCNRPFKSGRDQGKRVKSASQLAKVRLGSPQSQLGLPNGPLKLVPARLRCSGSSEDEVPAQDFEALLGALTKSTLQTPTLPFGGLKKSPT